MNTLLIAGALMLALGGVLGVVIGVFVKEMFDPVLGPACVHSIVNAYQNYRFEQKPTEN